MLFLIVLDFVLSGALLSISAFYCCWQLLKIARVVFFFFFYPILWALLYTMLINGEPFWQFLQFLQRLATNIFH